MIRPEKITTSAPPINPGLCAAGATITAAGLGVSIPGIILTGLAGLVFGFWLRRVTEKS